MRWPPDPDWPMAAHSRRVLCRPHRWHFQEAGPKGAPCVLLIHGAGGAAQSWHGIFPLLVQSHRVVALDLPGQGYTDLGARARCSLGLMTEDIAALMTQENWRPACIIGHSAGAAIALELARQGRVPEARIVGINAAVAAFDGIPGWLFPVMARALALTPLTASVFSATARASTVRRLIDNTGSTLTDDGIARYLRLVQDRAHVDATLLMMAHWDLAGLIAALPKVDADVTLLTGAQDRAVPPSVSVNAARALPNARHISLPGLGHLAHEEAPEAIMAALTTVLSS